MSTDYRFELAILRAADNDIRRSAVRSIGTAGPRPNQSRVAQRARSAMPIAQIDLNQGVRASLRSAVIALVTADDANEEVWRMARQEHAREVFLLGYARMPDRQPGDCAVSDLYATRARIAPAEAEGKSDSMIIAATSHAAILDKALR